ncbi:unnamed protein product [Heligmosomoides polygyrus]|uniref:Uncharacterized protein n=1 Tax=Heligmosomoides polygyrus TaxID=6339 RepID=A0A183FDU8_HELPZ|nr:unnamed protein product [Heligmosomoides polygyrus]
MLSTARQVAVLIKAHGARNTQQQQEAKVVLENANGLVEGSNTCGRIHQPSGIRDTMGGDKGSNSPTRIPAGKWGIEPGPDSSTTNPWV